MQINKSIREKFEPRHIWQLHAYQSPVQIHGTKTKNTAKGVSHCAGN